MVCTDITLPSGAVRVIVCVPSAEVTVVVFLPSDAVTVVVCVLSGFDMVVGLFFFLQPTREITPINRMVNNIFFNSITPFFNSKYYSIKSRQNHYFFKKIASKIKSAAAGLKMLKDMKR